MAEDKEQPDLSLIRHDIRNQLSNINLALEQLKYEIRPVDDETAFYLETIAAGCGKINELLNGLE
ncbi:hypothetical protein [Mucilaginibacter sp. KACC 22063]|uniref:hypothetical protein n=1 Tax=Mucilaginibacter sp. KACC 22063 TaxID=3025666 RepID=UPI00236620EF|nr:hypothetical protein [Mucilaginibacter sp. KACC 22063]WDF55693.1 hypothetical protein PQ461_01295 [Mucilaginibacter sp. KACC 22063]